MSQVLEAQAVTVIAPAASFLNFRQKSFVDNLLVCKIKWRAAELAGYNGDRNTLAQTANDLLKLPKIQAYYNECLESLSINPTEILAEIGEIARAPWKEFVDIVYDDEGNVIPAQVKLNEKLKALELAGKHHRMFADRVETESSIDIDRLAESLMNACLEAARRRAEASALPASTPDSE